MQLMRSKRRVPVVVFALATATLLLAACGGKTTDGSARAAAAASPSIAAAPAEGTPSVSPAPDTALFGRSTRVCLVNSSSRELELYWEKPGLGEFRLKSRETNCQAHWITVGEDIEVFVRHSKPDYFVAAEADNPSIGKPMAGLATVRYQENWSTNPYDFATCMSNRYSIRDRWSWDSGLFEVTITRMPDTRDNIEFTYEIRDSPRPSKDGESRNCFR
jgi:hypothetical protein